MLEGQSEKKCERNNPANLKVSAEGGRGGAPGPGAEIPVQPVSKLSAGQAVPWRSTVEQIWTLQSIKDYMPQYWIFPEGSCHSRRSHGGPPSRQELQTVERTRSSAAPVTPWVTHAGAVCSWRAAPHGKGPTLEQFLKNCGPREGPTLEQFMKDCLLWESPHAGIGEQCEKEGLTKTNCYKLHNLPSTLSCGTWGRGGRGRRVRKKGMLLSLERKWVWGKVALVLILLIISLVYF